MSARCVGDDAAPQARAQSQVGCGIGSGELANAAPCAVMSPALGLRRAETKQATDSANVPAWDGRREIDVQDLHAPWRGKGWKVLVRARTPQ